MVNTKNTNCNLPPPKKCTPFLKKNYYNQCCTLAVALTNNWVSSKQLNFLQKNNCTINQERIRIAPNYYTTERIKRTRQYKIVNNI